MDKPQLLLTFEESGDIGIHSDGNLTYAQLFVAGALLTRMAATELDKLELASLVQQPDSPIIQVARDISGLRKVEN